MIIIINICVCVHRVVVSTIFAIITYVCRFHFSSLSYPPMHSQLSNMNVHNQNNHSFMNNGKANSTAVQQMNNMGTMNGMNYNNSARQYHGNHHHQVRTI